MNDKQTVAGEEGVGKYEEKLAHVREVASAVEQVFGPAAAGVGKYGEPWRVGRLKTTIVSDVLADDAVRGADETEYYGGCMVAESVPPSCGQRAIECVNALAGKNPAAVGKVVAALRGIVESYPPGNSAQELLAFSAQLQNTAEDALADLKGGAATAPAADIDRDNLLYVLDGLYSHIVESGVTVPDNKYHLMTMASAITHMHAGTLADLKRGAE